MFILDWFTGMNLTNFCLQGGLSSSGWIRHMWLSWFSFSALPAVLCLCSFPNEKQRGYLHSSFSQTTSNPSTKSFGFTFKLYLHFHHFSIHCLTSVETILISSDLQSWPSGLPASTIENQYDVKYSYYMLSNNTYDFCIMMHCANQRIGRHWHEFDLISAFKSIYPLSGWIRHYTCHNAKQSQTMDKKSATRYLERGREFPIVLAWGLHCRHCI